MEITKSQLEVMTQANKKMQQSCRRAAHTLENQHRQPADLGRSLEDKMIFIDLKCGRSVYISDFHYSRTYGGLLEGLPNENMNNRIIQRALSRMDSIWGKRRTHLIPPEVDVEDPEHPSLPSTELTAWITCHEPVNEEYMGSELVLVWYVDDEAFETSSIRDVTSAALNAINWNELADDFDW